MPVQEIHMEDKDYHFPFIWIQGETKVKGMFVNCIQRREYENPVATLQIDENADVDYLGINDVLSENHTYFEMPLFVNNGNVKNLMISNIFDKWQNNEESEKVLSHEIV